ncbi:unnamed protein product [Heligmosomoides polygyrus]|uniref:EF-hand domain-containing protein n=1 Tax=Heligmosomoides polygyrus TaxID=6339 RepID=A0A183G788_HELPZ|nr:unnamed protein product [Heligmosomoides polygyrus]
MTKEQRYFHYFNMYDLNKDGRLDGIEVWKALTHMHVGEGLFAFVFSFNCICYIVYSLKRSERKEEEYERARKEAEKKQ